MELIVISQTKLKIMLSGDDMSYYELKTDKLEQMYCTDRKTRASFRHIFDDAEAQSGFHTSGERLFVQMFTSKCGGCEIFVTRLEDPPPAESPADVLTPGEEALIRRLLCDCDAEDASYDAQEGELIMDNPSLSRHSDKVRHNEVETRRIILSVTDLSILLSVCARLQKMGYGEKSLAYIDESKTFPVYHLLLDVPDGIFYLLPENYAFLKEYGEVTRPKNTDLYLKEHARILCADRAVQVLGDLHHS